MKKYYCITILALLIVTLLQGYNVSLQYKLRREVVQVIVL